jgi:cbb3-type cytochrome oxidase subunit 3
MGIIFLFLFIIAIFVFTIRKKKKDRTVWRQNGSVMTIDDRYNESKVETQKEVDRLLDKIHKSGYDSLSKKEKQLLDKYSQKV